MKYYRRYVGDYARDTAHLTLMEHGAYCLLLDAQYANEKPLPLELDALCRLCRAHNKHERQAVKAVVDQFFPEAADGRMNPRAADEIKKGRVATEAMKAAGKAGAKKRWGKRGVPHKNANGDATRVPHENPNGVPIDPPTSNKNKTVLRTAADAAPDEIIWGAGVNLLTGTGVSESSARAFLGDLRKRHEDGELAAVVWRCMAEKPIDPRAWLKAALGERKRRVVV